MSSLNLSYSLSAEDQAIFAKLQADSLLPSLAFPGEGELIKTFKANKRQEERNWMAPYADILEVELKATLEERKDLILQKLHACKETVFTVDLFSWNTVMYYEWLSEMQERVSKMTREEKVKHEAEQRERQRLIKENRWESTFGVAYNSSYPWAYPDSIAFNMPLKKVDQIFNKSDLAMRLSLALGPNFFPSTRWEMVKGAGDPSETGYSVYKKTLYVRYYPFGVPKKQMTKLLRVQGGCGALHHAPG
jgi:hypothetical protein